MVVTFIHTADWQLGKPFAKVNNPENRAILQAERIEALQRSQRRPGLRRAEVVAQVAAAGGTVALTPATAAEHLAERVAELMQLVEAGRIALDDPAAKYLPPLANPMVFESFDPATGAVLASTLRTASGGSPKRSASCRKTPCPV